MYDPNVAAQIRLKKINILDFENASMIKSEEKNETGRKN